MLLSVACAASTDDGLAALMHRLAARQGGHARFVEHQYLSLLRTPVESTGELVFLPPDHLEKRTLLPKPETVVIDKGTLTFERGSRRRSVSLLAYPQLGAFIESIRATLAGDGAALEAMYAVELAVNSTDWTLTLRPKDVRLASFVRNIRIVGHDDLIDTVEILRVDGDRSLMTVIAPTAG